MTYPVRGHRWGADYTPDSSRALHGVLTFETLLVLPTGYVTTVNNLTLY